MFDSTPTGGAYMARLRMRRSEVRDGLPAVCIKCGADADFWVRRQFAWHPPWVIALILVGVLVWVVVALVLTKRMTVDAPLCYRHKRHWAWRSAFIWCGLAAVVALGVGSAALVASADDPRGIAYTAGAVGAGLAAFGGFGWLIAAAMIQHAAIGPAEITDKSITLVRLSDEFVDAFYDEQDRLDAEYRADRAGPVRDDRD